MRKTASGSAEVSRPLNDDQSLSKRVANRSSVTAIHCIYWCVSATSNVTFGPKTPRRT
jgi:hypothetical protein